MMMMMMMIMEVPVHTANVAFLLLPGTSDLLLHLGRGGSSFSSLNPGFFVQVRMLSG